MTFPEDQYDDKKDKINSVDSFSTTTKRIKILIFVIIISIGIALSVLFFGTQLLFGGLVTPFFKVASESMIPILQVGDTIIVIHIPFSDLNIGDIIVFTSPYNSSQIIVHRIIDITNNNNNNETIIQTKGDANPFSIDGIDYPIKEHNYIGKVIYHISTTDPLYDILRPPIIHIIILATVTIIIGSILYTISIKRKFLFLR